MKREPLPPQEHLTPLEEQASKASLYKTQHDEDDDGFMDALFDKPDQIRRLTVSSAIETLALFAACLAFADVMTHVAKGTFIELPTFVWALMAVCLVALPVSGWFLVHMAGWPLSQLWLLAGSSLYLVGGLSWLWLLVRLNRLRLGRVARHPGFTLGLAIFCTICFIAIAGLMGAKPV